MKSLISKYARGLHYGEKGFTLLEVMVVLAILAILVGLVVPNFFKITEDAPAVMIQGQREKAMEAVYLYHEDCDEWPTEWSGALLATEGDHQLWNNEDDAGTGTVTGWDGPYIDRPIFQKDKWGGEWGVVETRTLANLAGNFTVLFYDNVPDEVCIKVDSAMDNGPTGWNSGAVQYHGNNQWSGAPNDNNRLIIVIAKE